MLRWIRALLIMLKAHKGQKDKGGHPYFLHPLRVSFKAKGRDAKIVGLVHDVLEDCPRYSVEDFNFLTTSQLEALKLLTKPRNMEYLKYIDRLKVNPIAIAVKLADLQDNMNLKRLNVVDEKALKRSAKYERAFADLLFARGL